MRFIVTTVVSKCFPREGDKDKKKQRVKDKSIENIEFETILELVVQDLMKLQEDPHNTVCITLLAELALTLNNAIIYQQSDDKVKCFMIGKLGYICSYFQRQI